MDPRPPMILPLTIILVILLTSSNYIGAWLQDRRQVAMLWMTASALLVAVSFAARTLLPPLPGIVLSNVGVMEAIGIICVACRRTRGRRVPPWVVLAPGVAWLALYLALDFPDHPDLRVVVTNLLAGSLFIVAPMELLRGEREGLVAGWWVAGILGIESLCCFGRTLITAWLSGGDRAAEVAHAGLIFVGLSSLVLMMLLSAGMVALVKEQTEQYHRRMAGLDALTGLGNRRRLNECLEQAVPQAGRSGRPLAVIMIDVDSFKAYNDHYGHPAGDNCLRAVADALQGGLVRRTDLVMRYGGEEFVVLLPDTSAAEAERIAERLRLAVRGLGLCHAGRDDGVVTISLGVAVLEPGAGMTDGAALLGAVDQALYEAKRRGRDQSVSYLPLQPEPVAITAP
ncbi:GGDEF domain-containing protein [Gluconacetobacter azotocaptans]|uniref:diguanylate cyclase n=1 Tax=Gluconacetobacter azotocaptans TaxID=142834 RepID=UPI0019586842|nr:GGDEF domain-containing protein [Gluconacetobacter azotocaptans]